MFKMLATVQLYSRRMQGLVMQVQLNLPYPNTSIICDVIHEVTSSLFGLKVFLNFNSFHLLFCNNAANTIV